MTPLNELEPQQDDKPTPGAWFYFAPEKSVLGSYDHGPMVLSKLGEHTVPVGEFDSVADAILCSYAPEMFNLLQKSNPGIAASIQSQIDAARFKR